MNETHVIMTDEQARIMGQMIGKAIGDRLVEMIAQTSFFKTEEKGIENLTRILGDAIGKARGR